MQIAHQFDPVRAARFGFHGILDRAGDYLEKSSHRNG
jgi:hypothetical protein